MSVLVRFMIPVVLVLAGGWYLVANSPGPSQVGGVPSPSVSPLPLTGKADLEQGTTYAMDGPFGPGSPRMVFTVPGEGWRTEGVWNVGKDLEGGNATHDIAMTPWEPADGLFADPCHWQGGEMIEPFGPTVDDMVAGLVQQAAGNAAPPTDVEVGGYPGKRVEITLPDDLDVADWRVASCDAGQFNRWTTGSNEYGLITGGIIYGTGQTSVLYIVDVDGIRGVIDTMYLPGVPEADIAEMEALVESMRFEWPEPSSAPSAS